MKLKVRLERWGKTVLFQVLEQSEDIERGSGLIFKKGEMAIYSEDWVSITSAILGIRGRDKEFDDSVIKNSFKSEEEAQEYLERVQDLIDSYNANVDIVLLRLKNGFEIKNGEFTAIYLERYENIFTLSVYFEDDVDSILFYKIKEGHTQGLTRDNLTIMFNRDCELLNIPFRIKEDD